MDKKQGTHLERALKALFVVFLGIFIISLIGLGFTLHEGHKEDSAFEALRAETDWQDPTQQLLTYEDLKAKNADYDGWLTIANTAIDYPVMYTPSDPEYYLRRAFDQTDSISGTPFLGEGCDQNSACCIIYGHNMDNGTMFGDVLKYADPAFRQSHPIINYRTAAEDRQYEIFAAVETRLLGDSEEGYRYYNAAGPLNPDQYNELVGWVEENALYETDIQPSLGQQILILSTCDNRSDDGRFLIVAHRVQ